MRRLFRSAAVSVAIALAMGGSLYPVSLLASDSEISNVGAAAARMFKTMPDDYYTIRVVAAEKELAAGVPVLIDVQEVKEFADEHIRGAKNIPLRSLAQANGKLPADKTRPILVYCKTGHRGAIAMAVLRLLGHENVRSIYGGITGWKTAGLPVSK